MDQDLIIVDPKIMMGKPVVAGTRVTVEHILEELGAGRSFEDLLASHPRLTRRSILAALAYAARILRNGETRPQHDAES
ncbi:MAG TPA: DUF433 domain-containing protein [Candidatus Eisenbacteria bacterium]|jgi:uncharacterized protein (DUF433 family)